MVGNRVVHQLVRLSVHPEFCPLSLCFDVVCNSNNSNLPSKTVNCYPGVVNLSDTILTQAKTNLLAKGLTFVDAPNKPDLGTIAEDLNKFHLSIKRHLALPKFQDLSHSVPDPKDNAYFPFGHQKFKNPSKWNPPCPMIIDHMNMINTEEILSPNTERKGTTSPRKNTQQNIHSSKTKTS